MQKVSIIIPAYNEEKYIEDCLYSISTQDYRDLEILVIDDGSDDSTSEIIQKCMASDERIKYFCQKHLGAGNARNYGIDISNGEYLMFVDADDLLYDEKVISTMMNRIAKYSVQIVGGSIYRLHRDIEIPDYVAGAGVVNNKKDTIVCVSDYFYLYGHTRFIYSAELIKKNKVLYGSNRLYEDQIFTIKALGCAKQFYELDYPVYLYRIYCKKTDYTNEEFCDILRGFRDTIIEIINNNMYVMFQVNYQSFFEEFCVHMLKHTSDETSHIIAQIDEKVSLYTPDIIPFYIQLENRVNSIRESENRIANIFDTSNKIVLYGAGKYANKIMHNNSLIRNGIAGVVVSGPISEASVFWGHSVFTLEDYQICFPDEDTTFLIAISQKYKDEIERNLNKYGYKSYMWLDINNIISDSDKVSIWG